MRRFGRNQLIAIVSFGATFIASFFVMRYMDVDKAKVWMNWSATFVPLAVGATLASSAVVKSAQALGKKKAP